MSATGEPISFGEHIKAHVAGHGDAILARLRDGSMPCDGAWPVAQIDLFQRWVESGMAQ